MGLKQIIVIVREWFELEFSMLGPVDAMNKFDHVGVIKSINDKWDVDVY